MRNHQNVKAALVGETFDERFVLFGPVLLGCLFSAWGLLSFSSPLRSVIIAIGVSFCRRPICQRNCPSARRSFGISRTSTLKMGRSNAALTYTRLYLEV
jgi:hypothetical protein